MKLVAGLGFCVVLFSAGWAFGQYPYYSGFGGQVWRTLTDRDRTLYVQGMSDGYSDSSDDMWAMFTTLPEEEAKQIGWANLTTPPELDGMAGVNPDLVRRRALSARGKFSIGQVLDAVDSFYAADVRNSSVCWDTAVDLAREYLANQGPTLEEIQLARSAGVSHGCH
jgi:hypothetical protein